MLLVPRSKCWAADWAGALDAAVARPGLPPLILMEKGMVQEQDVGDEHCDGKVIIHFRLFFLRKVLPPGPGRHFDHPTIAIGCRRLAPYR